MDIDNIIGILLALLGIIILIYAVRNQPNDEDSIGTHGTHIESIIFAVGLIVVGLIMGCS